MDGDRQTFDTPCGFSPAVGPLSVLPAIAGMPGKQRVGFPGSPYACNTGRAKRVDGRELPSEQLEFPRNHWLARQR